MRAAVGPAAPAPSGPTMCRMTEQCRGACLSAWERRSEWPLTAIALAFLAVYAWEVIADLHGAARAGTELAMDVMWAVFIADYLVRLALAPQRGRWFVRHLFDLAVVALPVLRPLRLVRLIALIGVLHRGAGMALRGRITAYTAGGVTLLVLVSSLAVLDAERGAPGTPIHTYGEAVWWALATITTVGYGDLAPVTAVGRWAAVLLMIGGVALAGVVTATLASWIVSLVAEESAEQEAATRAQVEVLQRQGTASSTWGPTGRRGPPHRSRSWARARGRTPAPSACSSGWPSSTSSSSSTPRPGPTRRSSPSTRRSPRAGPPPTPPSPSPPWAAGPSWPRRWAPVPWPSSSAPT